MVISNIYDLSNYLETDINHLERALYNRTVCGAWINWDSSSATSMTIDSIVEGSDAEFSMTFTFPFSSSILDNWLEELEHLTYEAWQEANDFDEEE